MKYGPIIIIDDDVDDREIIQAAVQLYWANHDCRFFVNAQQALNYFCETKEQPFLIFCDINMPVMTGLELRGKINSDPYLREKSIPFVFLTTSNNPRDVRIAYDLTIQGYFNKPTNFDALQKIVADIICYWSECLHPNS